mgnify:FL=1
MANRTFRQYGQAYAAKGDVSVVVQVAGATVFNGAVSDSSTVRSGQPTTEKLLYSFTMDEAVVGTKQTSVAVTGGELCFGPIHYNGWAKTRLSQADLDSNMTTSKDEVPSKTEQQWLATQLKDHLSTDDYNTLMAGNGGESLRENIHTANYIGLDWDSYRWWENNDRATNIKLNGSAINGDPDDIGWWVIMNDGDILTYDWKISAWDTAGYIKAS